VSLERLELSPLAPEANALSIELQGQYYRPDFTMRPWQMVYSIDDLFFDKKDNSILVRRYSFHLEVQTHNICLRIDKTSSEKVAVSKF
jgi:hypothetical protein